MVDRIEKAFREEIDILEASNIFMQELLKEAHDNIKPTKKNAELIEALKQFDNEV